MTTVMYLEYIKENAVSFAIFFVYIEVKLEEITRK